MVLGKFKSLFEQLLQPIAKLFMNINPNTLTILGLIISLPIVIVAIFIPNKQLATLTCLILLSISGFLDSIDGFFARIKSQVTKKGAFLDSVCDRYVDTIAIIEASSFHEQKKSILETIRNGKFSILYLLEAEINFLENPYSIWNVEYRKTAGRL